MREYPEYPDEWSEPDHPQAEFWKTDPAYWQAELDEHRAERDKVETKRFAWLREREGQGYDPMINMEYVKMRLDYFYHQSAMLGALLTLHEIGYPEPTSNHPVLT